MSNLTLLNQNRDEVKKLLNRYWEGETTGEEEKLLHTYFAQTNIAEEFRPTQKYFAEFQKLQNSPSLLPDETELVELPMQKGNKFLKYRIIGYSAAVIIAFVIIFAIPTPNSTKSYAIIDGKKYTNSEKIDQIFQQSLSNVKIDNNDILDELKSINFE